MVLSVNSLLANEGGSGFSADWYLLRNPDVAAAVIRGEISALGHFERYGWREGRDPGPLFDVSFYLSRYTDVAAEGVNPLTHYLNFGQSEGRVASPFFDASYYLGRYEDVADAVTQGQMTAYQHFLTHGFEEGRNAFALLDEDYYLGHNLDVAASSFSAFQHYAEFGQFEDRAPSDGFQPLQYATVLQAQGLSAADSPSLIQHYLTVGAPAGLPAELAATETPALPLAPVISDMLSNVTFLENTVNASAQKLDTSVTLTDSDTYHFSGGVLSVSGSGLAEDSLSFDTSGTVGIAGGNVSVGGLVVGTLTAIGAAGASLTLQLNGNATTPRIETLLENLTYANNSDTPTASRTATITLDDGNGGRTTHSIVITVTGEVDDQLLTGTAASDTLTGGTGNDTLVGLASADTLIGNGGNDLLYGGMDDSAIASYDLTALSTASNLKLWLDGNDLDGDGTAEGLSEAGLTGTAVGTWADKSNSGNSATQGTGGKQPTYTTGGMNGKNTLSFDGGDAFQVSNIALTSGATTFAVLDAQEYQSYLRWQNGGSHLVLDWSGGLISASNNGTTLDISSGLVDNSGARLAGISINIGAANGVKTYNDGTNIGTGTWNNSLATSSNLFIASLNGNSEFYTGKISEILIYNTALLAADRQALEYYLAEKWNLNVAGDADFLSGGSGSDTIYGGTGNDTIDGGADADTLIGGAGADSLVGGLAADLFRFTSTTDAGTGAAKDTIADFNQAQGDRIDLSSFTFAIAVTGTAAFTSPGTHAQIRWSQSGADTLIQLDTDGNGTGDLEILLQGFTANNLTTNDFLLPTVGASITGTAGADTLYGGEWNDTINTSSGNDTIYGWGGDDTITSTSGRNLIYAGAGNDLLTLTGGSVGDTIFGEGGNDTISVTDYSATIYGGDGDDQLMLYYPSGAIYGENGNDFLTGQTRADNLYGGNGNDTLNGDGNLQGADTLTGGSGNDVFYYPSYSYSNTTYLDLVTDFSTTDDFIEIYGYRGLSSGVSTIGLLDISNDGVYTYITDPFSTFKMKLTGVIALTASSFTFHGIAFNTTNIADTITGTANPDIIDGLDGNDSIQGGNGDDIIYGGNDADTIDGGGGMDFIHGGNGADSISSGALHGSTGDVLYGDAGDDTLIGNAYYSIVYGGTGNDIITLSSIAATGYGEDGNDSITGSGYADTINAGNDDDVINSGSGTDILLGGSGNDTLDGGAGADTLTGDAGADTFVFSNLTHSTNASPDRITDFTNGSDTIRLTGLGFTALSDFETLSHSAGVTTLADTGTSFAITFTGNVTALLDNTDFIW